MFLRNNERTTLNSTRDDYRRRWLFRITRAVALLWLLFQVAQAARGTVLVLYPEAPPPYQEAFEQMIAGLERSLGYAPPALALSEHYDLGQIEQWLSRYRDADPTLVVLGQRALAAAKQMAMGLPVLVGGVNRLPGQSKTPGVSLVIDPALFLETVKQLLPAVRTVVVVYHVQQPALILPIEQAALSRDLAVQPLAVSDAADAVRQLSRIFDTIDLRSAALWFTPDTLSLNTELLLPFILEQTWQRRIPAFSESVSHAQRGLLFALYPDYAGVGSELGERLQHPIPGSPPALAFTRAARLALNTRTAQHLALSLRPEIIGKAAVLFPAR